MGDRLKLTQPQMEALARLRSHGDFKAFEEVLREYEVELTNRVLVARDIVVIHQSQGGVEACRAIRQLTDSAPEALRRLANKEHA